MMKVRIALPAAALVVVAGALAAGSTGNPLTTSATDTVRSASATVQKTWVEGYYVTHRDCEAVGEQGQAAGDWDYYTCTLSRTKPHPTWALVVSEPS